jgi:predicted ATP-binding protein involved in virulence
MRIKQISVKGLFGFFDYVIPLNLDERITIIHAPNGHGKTIILKMLNGLFHQQYADLRKIPYRTFRVEFENSTSLEIHKIDSGIKQSNLALDLELEAEKEETLPNLSIEFYQGSGKKRKAFPITKNLKLYGDISPSMLDDIIPGLLRTSSKTWLYTITGEELSYEEVIDRYLPPKLTRTSKKEQTWFDLLDEPVNTYLIESQRLLRFGDFENSKARRRLGGNYPLPTVNAYSNELVQNIKDRIDEYATVSQSLDRSFPTRALRQRPVPEQLTDEMLQNKLGELEVHRNRLVEIGLLEEEEEYQNFQIQSQEIIDEGTRNFLTVYIEDVEKKLNVFGDLADKVDLFKRIINSRFSYKEMTISRETGFLFKSKYPDGTRPEVLSPASLSSGEQHELILLYELLFKVKENSLVLIDEPELSLHVGWQVNFLRDLQEVTKLAKLDMLIATHSPSLINDRWDLTVELKGAPQ